ncbi:MAG: DUF5723 family protein [Porphyromonadaceae bacterium]|nr:DUF5723 family protein [Porphyromonadaceae bacterium]
MMEKKGKKLILGISLFVAAIATAFAQTPSRTAYFLDGYDFRHQLNPAIQSPRSYFSLPVLGNTNVDVQSNLGVDRILFPLGDGYLTTFMSGTVPSDRFLGRLRRNNVTTADLSVSLLSVGIWDRSDRSFTTVDVGLKADVSANLPYSLFSFLKEAGNHEHYEISNLAARATSYFSIALGESYRLDENLTVGGKFKFLLGLADVNLAVKKLNVDMTRESWSIESHASFRESSCGLINIPTYGDIDPEAENPDELYYEGINLNTVGSVIGGYGAAIDLGAVYTGLIDGLTLSASVLDFGFIRWKSSLNAATYGNTWTYEGFDDFSLNSESANSFQNQLDDILNDIEDLARVYRQDYSGAYTHMLAATILLGVRYDMPFYRNLSAGALVTTHIDGIYSWCEGRVSANLAIGNWFGLALSYGLSNFGSSLGSAVNFHCTGLNLYFGMDTIPLCYTAALPDLGIGLPLKKAKVNCNFGLAFNVSNRLDHSAKF